MLVISLPESMSISMSILLKFFECGRHHGRKATVASTCLQDKVLSP